ncbi:unnamed protein product [Brachionus calyciflorus]|uniref:TNF receptor-associated factor n=1 Tax=Brachionus calyciflorus TaxID=104777 RepID=A0A814ITF9_9BILA|nr:unnamed protein product [Brachionus calyciflorus]
MDTINTSFSKQNILEYPPLDSSDIDEKFKCPECKEVIVNAHQADDCGCQYCDTCLTKIISSSKICKKCGQHVNDYKLPDKNLQNKIYKINVECLFMDCSWSGTLKEYIAHYKTHSDTDKCEYCLKIFDSKQELERHLDLKSGDCPKQLIPCEFNKICQEHILREQYAEHLHKNQLNHLKLTYEYFERELAKVKDIEINYKLKNLNDKDTDIPSGTVTHLSNKVDMLKNTQNGLIYDIDKIAKSNDKLKTENLNLKQQVIEYKNLAQELHKTLALTQVSLLTLEERLINLEKTSFDGSLLWKITNVHERMQEAKSGRQISFYSPPFYTNRNGYKMCSRIYLNGDGNGRNTHLSLFFVILRGENDALLRWPFRQKVTFILIDQSLSESRENVIDAFRPDPNSSSFKRPTSDMNIASGLPVFCPLGKFMSSDHEYIKDNTMFIKIAVDVKDLNEI